MSKISSQPLIIAIMLHFAPYEEKFWTSSDIHVLYLITYKQTLLTLGTLWYTSTFKPIYVNT